MSDEDIFALNRGGHDPLKVYAAYKAAEKTKDRPTVILAKTVKGYGMGEAAEGKNIAHGVKKVDSDALRKFRDRFRIPFSDEELEIMRDSCVENRDLAIIDLLASSGMRIGEMVSLNRQDIDFYNRECIVCGKGEKERTVYFDARTKIHLQKY